MSSSSPTAPSLPTAPSSSTPVKFYAGYIYILFIMRGDRRCPGVFHHDEGHKGLLAYVDDEGRSGPRKFRGKVFFKLEERIETKFEIIAKCRVAHLPGEVLPKWVYTSIWPRVDPDLWMVSLLRRLEKRRGDELKWATCPIAPPKEFQELVGDHITTGSWECDRLHRGWKPAPRRTLFSKIFLKRPQLEPVHDWLC